MWRYSFNSRFNTEKPLLQQLANQGLEFDPKLQRALEVSASKPNLEPEDEGFPDSYLTLALYRLNSILTRVVDLDENRYNLFHDYKLAPACEPEEVVPGYRLCGVLHKAAELAGSKKTIGVGHFLKAIVALSLDEEPEPAYGFENQVIHNTFSAETLLWGLGYTAWTPLSDAPEVQELLRILDGREPTESFQCLMAFESGKIVFRPASVLDTYRVHTVQGHESTQLAVLAHFRDQYTLITSPFHNPRPSRLAATSAGSSVNA